MTFERSSLFFSAANAVRSRRCEILLYSTCVGQCELLESPLHRRFENGTVRLVHKSAHGQADAQMPSTVQLTWPCSPAVRCAAPLLGHSSNASLPPSCSSSALRSAPSPLVALPSCPCLPRCLWCPSPCPLSLRHLCPPGSPLCCFARPPTSLRSSGEPSAAGAGPSRWRVVDDTGAAPVPHRCRAAGCSVCVRSRCERALLLSCCLSVSFCPPLPSRVWGCLLVGAMWRVVQCFLLSCLDARRGGVLSGVSERVAAVSGGASSSSPCPVLFRLHHRPSLRGGAGLSSSSVDTHQSIYDTARSALPSLSTPVTGSPATRRRVNENRSIKNVRPLTTIHCTTPLCPRTDHETSAALYAGRKIQYTSCSFSSSLACPPCESRRVAAGWLRCL